MTGTLRVGVAGLGAMGANMARNLQRHGLLAAVWNRTTAKAAALATELDCAVAKDPAELARGTELIITNVSADADVQQVVRQLQPGLRAGQIVVDCSTVASATARELASKLAKAGVAFLDAPVSGGVEGAKNGTLTFMVGGDAEAFGKALPAFEAMGKRIVHMGASGAGQATKAVNQVLCAGINQAVVEALAFAQALDLPADDVIDVIGSGAAGNWFINHRGKTMTRGSYAPGFKLALHHKDLKICLEMAKHAGVELPLSDETRRAYEALMQQGFGDEDISALFRLKRREPGNGQ